jgi:probable rRNA maturation factor
MRKTISPRSAISSFSNIVRAFYLRWRAISSRPRRALRRLTRGRVMSMLRAMAVLVRYRGSKRARVRTHTVRRLAERMLAALALEHAELSILLCDDLIMRGLNRDYRKRDRATDVLAFAMREGEPIAGSGAGVLGDIVISLPTAARQARANGCELRTEITSLLAHGLLHLLGFDHQTAPTERRMRARTDALVAAARAG